MDLQKHLKDRGLLGWHRNYYVIEDEQLVIFLLSNLWGKLQASNATNHWEQKSHKKELRRICTIL